MAATLKLEGFKELDDVLKDLSKATGKSALRRALITAAEPMAARARQLAPSDPETIDLDRKLNENIIVSTQAHGADAGKFAYRLVKGGGGTDAQALSAMRTARREAGGAAVEVYVGPTRRVFHGIFQEFGTKRHGRQSFLRPAFDAEAKPTLDRLKVELWDEINKAIERAARKAAKQAAKK